MAMLATGHLTSPAHRSSDRASYRSQDPLACGERSVIAMRPRPQCSGSPHCWTGCMRAGWMTGFPADRGPGPGRRPAPQPRPGGQAGILHHCLLSHPGRRGGRYRLRPSTGSKGPAGRCARDRLTDDAASRSCPRLARPRPDPSLTGFSDHLIAAAAKPRGRPPTRHSLAGRLLCCQPGSALSGRRPHPLRHHRWPDTPGRFTGNGCHGAHNQIVGPISVVQRQSGESS